MTTLFKKKILPVFPNEKDFAFDSAYPGSLNDDFMVKWFYGDAHYTRQLELEDAPPSKQGAQKNIQHIVTRGAIGELQIKWINWMDYNRQEIEAEFRTYLNNHMPAFLDASKMGRPSLESWYLGLAALRFSRLYKGTQVEGFWPRIASSLFSEKLLESTPELPACMKRGRRMLEELRPVSYDFVIY